MTPLETYLTDMRQIRSPGAAVKETSYYTPLENLLNEIGKHLRPRVRAIMQMKDRGAGNPDGGLFTEEQYARRAGSHGSTEAPSEIPLRGAIEVKGLRQDTAAVAESEQVLRYLAKYRQVLVTNYREFILVGLDVDSRPSRLESYRLADSEEAFWAAAAHPRRTAEAHDERLCEYVKRVMLHAARLADAETVASFLASYARDAKARIEGTGLAALAPFRSALEEALGLKFEGEKGEHFFRSSLVQTLFYGVFSAWVLWSKSNPPGSGVRFDWRTAAHYLRVAILRKLFHEVAEPGQLDALQLSEILDWTAAVLNRVERGPFFANFQESHAVQYFYEPFLKAFDPELRKELGVWYTPPEIVKYMVARVDTVLREELGEPDGLASKNVYVLDPCCGTGSYLVEVLQKIHGTLAAHGPDALTAADLKDAAQNRVFGFEILPAPFVVAHLQVGLLLQNLGAPLDEKGRERVSVYLTNALTGWEPPKEPKKRLPFPELEEERDAAEHVKRETPILVILGNPPYNAFAGVSPEEEGGLVEPYKAGLVKQWGIKKFNLDDLYVRFFRLAERRIAEMSKRGVVSFISNHSWVSEPSFLVLRRHLLASFDRFWIENMHGNRKVSEYAPDGRTSETVFAIPGFSAGIQQGVVISLWAKSGQTNNAPKVLFRDDLNDARATERRAHLLRTLEEENFDAPYLPAHPEVSNRFSFRPQAVSSYYMSWPKLIELPTQPPTNGLMEKRRGTLIDIDRHALEKRMRMYYDPKVSWEELEKLGTGLTENAARFSARKTRDKVRARENYEERHLLRYVLRPFDTRWCYYSPVRPLWNETRPELWAQFSGDNTFLMTRPAGVASPEGVPFFFTTALGDNDFLRGHAYYFPVRIYATGKPRARRNSKQRSYLEPHLPLQGSAVANISATARAYLSLLRVEDPGERSDRAQLVWMHVLAIGYSPAYLAENADGIRQVAALLDTESPVAGVTSGTIRAELRLVGAPMRVGGGSLKEADLAVTAGWGHAGKGGVTMPGKGKLVQRDYTEAERKAIAEGALALGVSLKQAVSLLGERTFDIYLNDVAYWADIPARVWEYTIGGYPVIKKWLSYRARDLLRRPLRREEVRYVQEMARRIGAIILLEPQLDANYCISRDDAFPWPPNAA